jgi:transposase
MNYKWFVGIDVSKKTIDVTLFLKDQGVKSPHKQFCNDKKGFQAIIRWVEKQNVDLKTVLFCMEHTGVYSLDLALFFEQGHFVYSMVSPLHIKRSLGLVRGKNDKVDSFQISKFCYLHRDELFQTKLPLESIQLLKSLINERRRLVNMQKSEKIVYSELRKINTCNSLKRIETRIAMFSADIKCIEQEIEKVINSEPSIRENYRLIRSVIGIGLVNSVMFIVYTCNFQKFTDARKYACYGGVAPFENSSGTSIRGKTKVSHLANKRIKTNLSNAARSAIQNDPELRLYYDRKAKEGKAHGVIMNAVKFKLITRVFAVVERRTPFVKLRQAG